MAALAPRHQPRPTPDRATAEAASVAHAEPEVAEAGVPPYLALLQRKCSNCGESAAAESADDERDEPLQREPGEAAAAGSAASPAARPAADPTTGAATKPAALGSKFASPLGASTASARPAGAPRFAARSAAGGGGSAGRTDRADPDAARDPGATTAPPADASASAPRSAQDLALGGVAGAGRSLPELARIQAAFGHHDVTAARVEVGGPAERAAERIGARAYTIGDRIGFRREPDLRLAAHEAAHLVQQRRGIELRDGQGRAGDLWERHADAVAARVVAGRSAEDLLDRLGPAEGVRRGGVQRACDCGTCERCQSAEPPSATPDEDALLQRELEVDAVHLYEPGTEPGADAAAPAEAEETAESAGGDGAPARAPRDGDDDEAADGGADEGVDAGAAPSGAAGSDAGGDASAGPPSASESVATSAGGPGGDAGAGAAGGDAPSSGGLNATCYRADIEEPEEEDEEEHPDPEPTESQEQMGAESPDASEGDDCPVGEGLQSAASSAPASGEAADAAGASLSADAASAAAPASRSGGGGAHGGGAASGGDDAAAPAEAAPVADSGEAARDAAVARYAAARERLAAAGAGGSTIGAPALDRLGPTQKPIAVAGGEMFAGVGDAIGETVAEALGPVPDRLGVVAAAAKAGIGAAIEAEKSAVSARIAAARAGAIRGAAVARARINASHARAVTRAQAGADAALATLAAARPAAATRIDTAETTGLDGITSAYATSRQAHVNLGTQIGAQAIARGDAYAAAYGNCKINRKDSFTAGYLTDRRAEAQQNAAREVAKGYKKSLEDTANKQAAEMMKGRQKDRCGLRAIATGARGSLDRQSAALTAAVGSGLASTLAQLAAGRDQLLASVQSSLGSTLAALAAQESQQRQAANDLGYQQQVAVEQLGFSAGANLLEAVAGAVESVGGLMQQVQGQMSELADAEPGAAVARLAQLRASVQNGLALLRDKAGTAAGSAEAQLGELAASADAAMAQLAQSHEAQNQALGEGAAHTFDALGDSATQSLRSQAEQAAARSQSLATQGSSSFDLIVGGVESGATRIIGNVSTALRQSEEALGRSLRESLRDLDGDKGIPKQARIAASKEQPAWKSVVKWVLIIAIIIVVAVVIGPAVIGAVGAAAGALGASAAAATVIGTVVGGAIVGAASSAVIQVVNNWASGERLTKGVGRAAIMGAVGGALGAAGGLVIGRLAQAYQLGMGAQFAMGRVLDAAIEVGTEAYNHELSWESFGFAMLMSTATGAFGEIPRVRSAQARVMHGAASRVPGAGAARFAASIRPPSGAGPHTPTTEPVRGAAPEASGGAPHPSTETPASPPAASPEAGATPPHAAAPETPSTGPHAGEPTSPSGGRAPEAESSGAGRPHEGENAAGSGPREAEATPTAPHDDAVAAPETQAEASLLQETAAKPSESLSPQEALAERAIAERAVPEPISEPPFTTERKLANGHEIKETPEGEVFSRCSENCAVFDAEGRRIERRPRGVTAGPDGVTEHPAGPEPVVEQRRGGPRPASEVDARAEPRPAERAPESVREDPRVAQRGEEIEGLFDEAQGRRRTTPEDEFSAHADDVRDDAHPRTSESTSEPERVAAARERGEREAFPSDGNAPEPEVRTAPDEPPPGDLFHPIDLGDPVSHANARETYLGATPGKYSDTGLEVVARMRAMDPPRIRGNGELLPGNPNRLEVMDGEGNWHLIDENVDMSHHPVDAVTWWNNEGRYFGARTPAVRDFMLSPENYILEPGGPNQLRGARSGERYLPPDESTLIPSRAAGHRPWYAMWDAD